MLAWGGGNFIQIGISNNVFSGGTWGQTIYDDWTGDAVACPVARAAQKKTKKNQKKHLQQDAVVVAVFVFVFGSRSTRSFFLVLVLPCIIYIMNNDQIVYSSAAGARY